MVKRMDAVVGDTNFDNLIFDIEPAVKQKPVTVASGQGKLTRGSALGLNSTGKCVILGTEETEAVCPANCILAEDVDTTSGDVQAMAFIAGHFNKQALTLKADYTMTDEDMENFRKGGIFLSDSI